MRITLDLSIFTDSPKKVFRVGETPGLKRLESEKALLWIMEGLININRMEIRTLKLPPLYKAGVVYKREPSGAEDWRDCSTIIKNGSGDCEDLACWRVAELRNNGKFATPYIRWRADPVNGIIVYHVLVFRSGNILEDPSKILGMDGVD